MVFICTCNIMRSSNRQVRLAASIAVDNPHSPSLAVAKSPIRSVLGAMGVLSGIAGALL